MGRNCVTFKRNKDMKKTEILVQVIGTLAVILGGLGLLWGLWWLGYACGIPM